MSSNLSSLPPSPLIAPLPERPKTGSCNSCQANVDSYQGITTRCDHLFHTKCLVEVLKKRNTCPTCNDPTRYSLHGPLRLLESGCSITLITELSNGQIWKEMIYWPHN